MSAIYIRYRIHRGDLLREATENDIPVLWSASSCADADALIEAGQHAFAHTGPEFTAEDSEALRGFGGLLLVEVALDDAGAYCAASRWRLIADVVGPRGVQLRAGARDLWEGATLADHLSEGYSLDETRRVSLRDMRSAIDRETDRRRVRSRPLLFERQTPIARTVAV